MEAINKFHTLTETTIVIILKIKGANVIVRKMGAKLYTDIKTNTFKKLVIVCFLIIGIVCKSIMRQL